MTKAELRRQNLARQQSLPLPLAESLSQDIADRLFEAFDWSGLRTVHCFLPIAKNREINTWLIIRRLQRDFPQVRIAVPQTNARTFTLTNYQLTPDTVLQQTRWGVPEPRDGEIIPAEVIDCVLLPLLAYDQRGYRVGYGKGFYDRFLIHCRPDVIRIGLSYFDPETQIADISPFDVPLHHCLTPERIWSFAPVG